MAHQSNPGRNSLAAAQTIAGGVIGLGLLGYVLDRTFDTAPYLLLAGLLIALIVGFYDLWRAMFPPGGDT